MPEHIHLEVEPKADKRLTVADVREALSQLDDDDLSASSPVSAGVPEAGIEVDTAGNAHVRVEGWEGDFTRTSERALSSALSALDTAGGVAVVSGGYESE